MGVELTPAFLRTVKPDSRVRTYGDGRGGYGLTLYVQPNGFKRWYQRLRIKGRPTDIGLGGYPLVTLGKPVQVANKVEAAYFRTNLVEKRRKLMQQWADYLGVAPAASRANGASAPSR